MDAVARCTDIQVEVSRLLNGYVIWIVWREQTSSRITIQQWYYERVLPDGMFYWLS
jgi:hypothetical protein